MANYCDNAMDCHIAWDCRGQSGCNRMLLCSVTFSLVRSPQEKTHMGLRIVQVDAFTDTPVAGNPAAVCVLAAPCEEQWMQQVAREMNLSETAFLCRRSAGFDLRRFTPAVQVPLCAHATLARPHLLWEDGHL